MHRTIISSLFLPFSTTNAISFHALNENEFSYIIHWSKNFLGWKSQQNVNKIVQTRHFHFENVFPQNLTRWARLLCTQTANFQNLGWIFRKTFPSMTAKFYYASPGWSTERNSCWFFCLRYISLETFLIKLNATGPENGWRERGKEAKSHVCTIAVFRLWQILIIQKTENCLSVTVKCWGRYECTRSLWENHIVSVKNFEWRH